MTIEAPYSKHKKMNFIIGIMICLAGATWFGYDGYFNEEFKERHLTVEGTPDDTLKFNQKSPPYFLGASIILGVVLLAVKNKKIVADENGLVLCCDKKISYDSIESIDKTHFDSKGFFVIKYKDGEKAKTMKINDRKFDNLAAVLDQLVAKIS